MTSRAWAGLLVVLGVVDATACSRADVYAVTGGRTRVGAAGEGGASGGSASGGSASGGSASGGSASGGSASGGSANASDASVSDGNTGDQSAPQVICPSPALQSGDRSVTLTVGSVSRSYILHVPSAYDGTKPVPLVLDFHGVGVTGWGELSSSPYPAVTDPEGVIMAFPDGKEGPAGTAWNLGPCCVANVDDLGFARAVVTDVQKTACIDPDRVYAVGVLTGGGMVYSLACHAADVFAAVAPAAFDLLEETVDQCQPARPITVVSFRGNGNSRVPYDGGASSLVPGMPITFLGAEATFERWAQIDGCTGSPSESDANGCSSYSGCSDGVEVILCVQEGGTVDPGDANIAWPVLKRHSL
jgi:polyhydroxybutyrate depolymerase